jgi:hypothetical protein
VVVTPVLNNVAPQFRGLLLAVYRVSPDSNALALTHLTAIADPNSTPIVPVPVAEAVPLLTAYAAALLALPIILNRRRDAV